jgi:hypothetical protein
MSPELVDRELNRNPFLPVRLHLSDGTTVDIRDPELAFIVRGALYVVTTGRVGSRIVDDIRLISLRHIVRLEAIEQGAA